MQGLAVKVAAVVLLILSIFASGYSVAWKQLQVRIGELQGAINLANAVSAQVKAKAETEVERVKQEQLEVAKKLQGQYDEAKKRNAGLRDELDTAWVQYRAANKPRSNCPPPVADNTSADTGDNATGGFMDPDELSEELNKFVREAAPIIDQRDIDLHLIIQWLNSLPQEIFDGDKPKPGA